MPRLPRTTRRRIDATWPSPMHSTQVSTAHASKRANATPTPDHPAQRLNATRPSPQPHCAYESVPRTPVSGQMPRPPRTTRRSAQSATWPLPQPHRANESVPRTPVSGQMPTPTTDHPARPLGSSNHPFVACTPYLPTSQTFSTPELFPPFAKTPSQSLQCPHSHPLSSRCRHVRPTLRVRYRRPRA